MCYSDFNEIIRDIYEMDADVISIENARSSDEILSVFKDFNYDHHIGPGVYDVHSPVVPTVPEIENKIKKILNHIRKDLLWINPDCGLKTRDYSETVESLKNMVVAAKNCREKS
jgi:5-methyltetrahydropteroyltriglutamate--homocysteine methyltransferase